MQVYLDNAATTPIHPKVLEAMLPYFKESFGNPSSIHSYGTKVRVAIEEARETIAETINCKASEIYFLSGGTEANNFAIKGIINAAFRESGKNRLLTSEIEHHAVLDTIRYLAKDNLIIYPKLTNYGTVSLADLRPLLTEQFLFASFMHVNNEIGCVNDLQGISSLLNDNNILFHSDCVQSFCKYNIDVKKINIDSITGSSHKINGPKGTGFAYIKTGTPMESFMLGGSQERNRRGGTENVPGIIGFASAVKIFRQERNNYYNTAAQLKDYFINGLKQIDNKGIIINSEKNSSPYILNVSFNSNYYKNDIEAILVYLDINGVAASGGAACSSGTLKPSHVLLGIGADVNNAKGTIRFSFGFQNTLNEIDYTLSVINKLLKQIKK
ncbi:MAG: cysteine desulfurase family protein [bacterium]